MPSSSALQRGDRSADRDVLGERLGNLRVDALPRQIPRLDLVGLVVAQCVEDRTPALAAEAVAPETANEGVCVT